MDFGLLESVPDAMVIADATGTIVFVNAIGERLFGWPREELIGRPIEVLLPARFRAAHQVHRAGYQAAPRAREMGLGLDLAGLKRDGHEFAAEISLSPIAVEGGQGVVAAVRDVTERKQLEDRARLWRKAQDEVRDRDEFLSVASHELRTPVTALQLQLQLLHRATQQPIKELPRLVDEKLQMLERQTRRIALLVNELLDVSRMRLGQIALRYEPLDLAEVVRESVDHLRADVERTGSALHLDVQPVQGRWDRIRIEQVVINLVVNASKFGEGRPILLAVDADPVWARLRVTDEGIGIPAEDQSRVFERFERAVPAQHFGGLGLGLYIARQIVEAHGGRIAVASIPGQGATFTVEIPREPPEPAAAVSVH